MRVVAITESPPKEQVATHNKSEAIASESEDRDETNNLECLNRFAHDVQHGKKMSQNKTKTVKSMRIQSEEDIHKANLLGTRFRLTRRH